MDNMYKIQNNCDNNAVTNVVIQTKNFANQLWIHPILIKMVQNIKN